MQFITVALLAVASLTNAQSVPSTAPGCVKYCLRIAREQAPSACTWAGWCALSGFQDSVNNCLSNTCGPTNQQAGQDLYQQICSSAGSDTTCPSGGASTSAATTAPVSSALSSASSAISSLASEASSAASSASDVVTTIGGVATTIPASATSSFAAGLSSSAAQATSSAESVSSSVESALSTATAPVSSAISSLLSSAASVVSSATAGGANASQSPNAASVVGLPSSGQIVSLAAIMVGVAGGALML